MFSRIGKGIVDFDTFGMVPGCSTHVHVHIYTHASTSSSEARERVQNKERGRKGERVGTRQGRRQKDENLELVDKITQQDARTERFF